MAKTIIHCIADHPQVVAFVDSLPEDPERDRLADTYRHLAAEYLAIASRSSEVKARIEAVTNDLIDTEGKARDALRTELAGLGAELDAIPRMRALIARRYAEALGAWGTLLRAEALRAYNAAADQVIRLQTEGRPHITTLDTLDQSIGLRDANQDRYDTATREKARLAREHEPFQARKDAGKNVMTIIDGMIELHFGDMAGGRGTVFASEIARFVGNVEKQAA